MKSSKLAHLPIYSGAEIIVKVLVDEGVDTVFGYSGGAILPTYDAVFRHNDHFQDRPEKQIKFVVPANEQGAGFMAAGYARASGRVGVFMVTSGPGATNSVTPIADCNGDSIPVVLICGQVPRASIGTDAFQEAPVTNIMAACAKQVFLVTDPDELERTLRTAFEIARTGRPGPVVVDIPKDVQNWRGRYLGHGTLRSRGYADRIKAVAEAGTVDERKQEEFFRLLKRSRRPLLYVGGGVITSGATEALRKFAEKYEIPAVMTLMGLGALPAGHPLCLGMLGMHGMPYANYAVEDCDFLIAVGARFDDRVAGRPDSFAPNVQAIAQIDIDETEIGKIKKASWSHVGDASAVLKSLLTADHEVGSKRHWVETVDRLRTAHALDYRHETISIQPQNVIELLSQLTKGQAIITTGVGQHQMWVAQYFGFVNPRSLLTSGSMGTMGFGLPAAIGAQLACPDRTVIDIDGDGSLRMNIGELETANTYSTPVKVLLLNNLGDGMIRQWQRLYFSERLYGSDKALHSKDFVLTAKADGFGFAKRVLDPADLVGKLKEFVAYTGPAFLEVLVDPEADVYPMVGPGQSYAQMVTGPYIQARAGASGNEKNPGGINLAPDMF
jgi:acetolactate synthase-1/2/3 large subunit